MQLKSIQNKFDFSENPPLELEVIEKEYYLKKTSQR